MPDLELIYVGDPMCSWCYGFGPVVENLDARFSFPTRLIIGGLRPGPAAEVLDDRMRRFLRHHWEEIGERTGQPFDLSGLDRENWAYDTMTADTAAVTMREIDADVALAFFARLQQPASAQQFTSRVTDAKSGEVRFPETGEVVAPAFLGGERPEVNDNMNRRALLADWITARDNPYFARATVNRIWAQMFGRGLVDPVDDLGKHNPPSHPQLLDELADYFVAS
ncbi:MAG: DUF1553 domain-containing protein, partial [Acidobacteria bacterium]|nr:DUF1553 domain-containing protein [Acidobacteriota bacterium]